MDINENETGRLVTSLPPPRPLWAVFAEEGRLTFRPVLLLHVYEIIRKGYVEAAVRTITLADTLDLEDQTVENYLGLTDDDACLHPSFWSDEWKAWKARQRPDDEKAKHPPDALLGWTWGD